MCDDFSALELDTDQDEEMLALFGRSPDPPAPSTSASAPGGLSSSKLPVNTVPPPVTQNRLPSRQHQSLLCVTNKRPAVDQNQSWPNKARHTISAIHVDESEPSLGDLELDSWGPNNINTLQAKPGLNRQHNAFPPSAARSHLRMEVSASMTSAIPARPNLNSQATELWQSAYSRPPQASQASVSIQRASAAQQSAPSHHAGVANPMPRQPRLPEPDISTAMVCAVSNTLLYLICLC